MQIWAASATSSALLLMKSRHLHHEMSVDFIGPARNMIPKMDKLSSCMPTGTRFCSTYLVYALFLRGGLNGAAGQNRTVGLTLTKGLDEYKIQ